MAVETSGAYSINEANENNIVFGNYQPSFAKPLLINALGHVLIAFFGAASWMGVNTLWVELPLVVLRSPEGWNLAAYITVIVQISCIGPLVAGVVQSVWREAWIKARFGMITGIYVVSAVSVLTFAFAWDDFYAVAGSMHSVALLVAAFLVSLAATTSNVVFIPALDQFKTPLTSSYFVGMGLGGFVPSMLSLAQGSGQVNCIRNETTNATYPVYVSPRYSLEAFCGIIVACLVVSYCSYIALKYSKLFTALRSEYEELQEEGEPSETITDTGNTVVTDITEREIAESNYEGLSNNSNSDLNFASKWTLTATSYFLILFLTAWVDAIENGILPSISTYASLPYGQSTYHYAVALAAAGGPLGSLSSKFAPKTARAAMVVSLLATAGAVYRLAAAVHSPNPPLAGTVAGSVITVAIAAIISYLLMFGRALMATTVRLDTSRPSGLFWIGAATQIGSFTAALVMFPLVSIEYYFKSADYC